MTHGNKSSNLFDYNGDYEEYFSAKIHSFLTNPDKKGSYLRWLFNSFCNFYLKWKANNVASKKIRAVRLNFRDFKTLHGAPENKSNIQGKICTIFSTFSSDGKIPPRVVYALNEYSKVSDYIIVVGDYALRDSAEYAKIGNIVNCAYYVRHHQYDIGSWHRAMQYLKKQKMLDVFDYLILTNDSNYGPIYPLVDIYNKMDCKNTDFWGITKNYEPVEHIQSYFLAFRKKVFLDDTFQNFFQKIPSEVSFDIAVNQYELKLTSTLSKKYTYSTLVTGLCEDIRGAIAGTGNPTIWPLSLISAGSPFVKRKAINMSFGGDLHQSELDVICYIRLVNPDLANIIEEENPCISSKNYDSTEHRCNPLNITSLINNVDVVSFDIFDTLLIRPFVNPVDLFQHIGNEYNLPEFPEKRIQAESAARLKVPSGEITLNEIYDEIDSKYRFLKEVELRVEIDLIRPNKNILNYFEEVKKNKKKIICVSDTYFDKPQIEKMLHKCGFNGIYAFYLSSAEGDNKGRNLFSRVISDLKINPDKILHIGDNTVSDYEIPIKKGMHALHITKLCDLFLNMPASTPYNIFYNNTKTLSSSVYIALISRYRDTVSKDVSFWFDFGYCLGGPFVCGYLHYIRNIVKLNQIDKIFFAARDGYQLKTLFEKYFSTGLDVVSEYVYLSRHVGLISTLDYEDEPTYLQDLLTIVSKDLPQIVVSDNYQDNKTTFVSLYSELKKWSAPYYESFSRHLLKCAGDSKRIVTVDMTTTKMSSYRYAKHILGDRILFGIGSASFANGYSVPHKFYLDRTLLPEDTPVMMLTEQLITSPEAPIMYLDDGLKPVYSSVNISNPKIISEIQKGIEYFVKDFTQLFSEDAKCTLTMSECLNLLENYLHYPTPTTFMFLDKLKHTSKMDGVSECISFGEYVHKFKTDMRF